MIRNLLVLLIVLLFLAGGLYFFQKTMSKNKSSVLGVISKNIPENTQIQTPSGLSKEDINGILEQVKSGLSEITSENASSSSAKIQKIINDLKSIQEKKALDFICEQVCKK